MKFRVCRMMYNILRRITCLSIQFETDNMRDVWRKDLRLVLRDKNMGTCHSNLRHRISLANPVSLKHDSHGWPACQKCFETNGSQIRLSRLELLIVDHFVENSFFTSSWSTHRVSSETELRFESSIIECLLPFWFWSEGLLSCHYPKKNKLEVSS